ncbi:unnamed protein product, partial [Meganyctiphanes norvegica]
DPRPIIFKDAGTAHSTSIYSSGYPAEDAFDEIRNTYWASAARTTYPQSIWFEFNDPVRVVKFAFRSTHNTNEMVANGPSKYEIFFSDGPDCSQMSTWVTLFTDNSGVGFTASNEMKEGVSDNAEAHKCYGFKVNKTPEGNGYDIMVTITDIKFWEI